jgi:cobalt-precorrin 5A hydrolase
MSELESVVEFTKTISPYSLAAIGLPSVAETAALAAAGRKARLLVPRVATKEATCAIAVGEGP